MNYTNIIPYNENVWWSRKIQNQRQNESKKGKTQLRREHLQNKLNVARKGTKYVCLIFPETADKTKHMYMLFA